MMASDARDGGSGHSAKPGACTSGPVFIAGSAARMVSGGMTAPPSHPVSGALSRFARLLMLALVLVVATARPAAAQSVLRDSETELLFRDISRPLITAAGL